MIQGRYTDSIVENVQGKERRTEREMTLLEWIAAGDVFWMAFWLGFLL